MKLKETITQAAKIDMIFNAAQGGIFPSLFNQSDAWYDLAPSMSLSYYTVRSANKTVAPVFHLLIENAKMQYPDATQDELFDYVNDILGGRIIRPKFIAKWNKIYDDLFELDYSPLDDVDEVETKVGNDTDTVTYDITDTTVATNTDKTTYDITDGKTGTNSDTTTYNITDKKIGENTDKKTYDLADSKTGNNTDKTTYNLSDAKEGTNSDKTTYDLSDAKTGNNTDTTTYDWNLTDDGKTGTNTTTTVTGESANDMYGFNSTAPVGDTLTTDSETTSVVGDADRNTRYNKQTKDGTESKAFGINETLQKTGTEDEVHTISETLTKTGTEDETHTISESGTKTGTEDTEHNISETGTKTGTEAKQYSISESLTKTGHEDTQTGIDETAKKQGTETKTLGVNQTVTRKGRHNIGADLIDAEIDMRNRQIFFDIVFKDIDSVLTLSIY